MSRPEDRQFDQVDRLVRAHLDQLASRIDARDLRARIGSELGLGGEDVVRPAGRRRMGLSNTYVWPAVAAVLLLGSFLGVRWLQPERASAAHVLAAVRDHHSREVDRCYRVRFIPHPEFWDGQNQLNGPSETILWTRGDRFWADCTIGDLRLSFGRQADGSIWVSPSPKKGIRFVDAPSQLPDPVATICAINAMTFSSLVDDVLADFDLAMQPKEGTRGRGDVVLRADLKPGAVHPLISSAKLEIDREDHLLVRLEMQLLDEGRPKGSATFELLDRGSRPDGQYELESHLDADATLECHQFGKGKVEQSLTDG